MAECTKTPLVGILMGSNSDWEVMKNAAQMLRDFNVPFEARVVSAHRMPDEMFDYAEHAAERGIRVIIAGAGGAAQMPKGVPVATFAIGEAGAANAALYACQILALGDTELTRRLADFRIAQNAKARAMTLPVDTLE